ncbi:hypothetical protein [Methanocella sp. MCL-LM]|uniref:hypothetical protein n=1 Tax=Methanocella sp. MCL-LM TaxID=3412035 RepID=UPI003C75E813
MAADELRDLQDNLVRLASRIGVKKVGFADLSRHDHPLTGRFPVGISLITPIGDIATASTDEAAFHEQQLRQRAELEVIKARLGEFLSGHGYRWHSVGNDTDQERLTGELSHKMVAVSAGIGWMGKSSLLVTPEYGPCVRLTTILTDAPFQTYKGSTQSRCGACTECVDACPVHALKGREWQPGISRDDMIDVFLCNNYRISIGVGLGRKHSCGYCLRACCARAKP